MLYAKNMNDWFYYTIMFPLCGNLFVGAEYTVLTSEVIS